MSFVYPLCLSLVCSWAVLAFLYRRYTKTLSELGSAKTELEALKKLKKEQLTTDANAIVSDLMARGATVVRIDSGNLLLWHGMRS